MLIKNNYLTLTQKRPLLSQQTSVVADDHLLTRCLSDKDWPSGRRCVPIYPLGPAYLGTEVYREGVRRLVATPELD